MRVSRGFSSRLQGSFSAKKTQPGVSHPLARAPQTKFSDASVRPEPSRSQVRTLIMYLQQNSPLERERIWPGAPDGFWLTHASLVEKVGLLYKTQEALKNLNSNLNLPNTNLNKRFRSLLALKVELVERLVNMVEFYIGSAYWEEHSGEAFFSQIAEEDWIDCDEGVLLQRAVVFANVSAEIFFRLANNPQLLRDQGGHSNWQQPVEKGQPLLQPSVHSLKTCARNWNQFSHAHPNNLENLLATYVRQVSLAMPEALHDLNVQMHNFEQFLRTDRGAFRARPNLQQTEAHFRNSFFAMAVIIHECEAIVNGLQIPQE